LDQELFILGTWALGSDYYSPVSSKEGKELLLAARNLGFTTLDTAPVYGKGHSELLIGQAFKNHKNGLKIQSKLFFNKKKGLISSFQKILKRTGMPSLETLFIHWPSQDGTLEETWETFQELKAQGLVKKIGVSNLSPLVIDGLIESGGLDVVQWGYNALFRKDRPLLQSWHLSGVEIQAYSPLAQGLLGGHLLQGPGPQDGRKKMVLFHQDLFPKIQIALGSFLKHSGLQPSDLPTLALCWLKKEPWVDKIILGPRTEEQLKSLVDRLDLQIENKILGLFEEMTKELCLSFQTFPDLFHKEKKV